jgi:hypothetical protein
MKYKKPKDYRKPLNLRQNSALGYIYFTDKEHPLAIGKAHVVYYHRHLMSVKISRWLEHHEHVHHKDGDRTNNSLDNLELLTHSAHMKKHRRKQILVKACKQCGLRFEAQKKNQIFCSNPCYKENCRKFKVSKSSLKQLVWQYTMTEIGKRFGISANAVKKRCEKFGIKRPPHGFFFKKENFCKKCNKSISCKRVYCPTCWDEVKKYMKPPLQTKKA